MADTLPTTTTTAPTGPTATGGDRGRALARVAFWAAATFVALLAVLHVVEPDLDPSWRVISEYEFGDQGWLMQLAFLALAAGCGALALALRPLVPTRGGRVGLGFLWLSAAGLAIAALATTDPITAAGDDLTTHGRVHGLGAALGIPGLLVAATLVTRSLGRDPRWAADRRTLVAAAALAWASMVAFGLSVALTYDGDFGPDVKQGWPNRAVAVAYAAWVMVAASRTGRHAAAGSRP
jgi:Protein of unknown function (DUF998)